MRMHALIDGNKLTRDSISQVRKKCQLYAENASKRLDLLADAFSAQDNSRALELVSQVKSLSEEGAKLIKRIKYNLVSKYSCTVFEM